MMKSMKTLLLFLAFLYFSSCASTLKVSHKNKKVAGIPFYSQKAVIQQKTKYLYDWVEISLLKEETINGKQTSTLIHKTRIIKGQDLSAVESKLSSLNKDKATTENVQTIIKEIKKMDNAPLESDQITSKNIIENCWIVKTVVDYSDKYYLNSRMSWIGTSSLSQKLAANGTLA